MHKPHHRHHDVFVAGNPWRSDVPPLTGISGLPFDSFFPSPLLFFCQVLLLFLSCYVSVNGPFSCLFFPENFLCFFKTIFEDEFSPHPPIPSLSSHIVSECVLHILCFLHYSLSRSPKLCCCLSQVTRWWSGMGAHYRGRRLKKCTTSYWSLSRNLK